MSLDHAGIAALLPHGGRMCLLARVIAWDAERIACAAWSHLDADNPLRRAGMLPVLCGLEYPLQAAALHGALRDGATVRAGYVARLREVTTHVERLDDPGLGELRAGAVLEGSGPNVAMYSLRLDALGAGRPLLRARVVVALGRDG